MDIPGTLNAKDRFIRASYYLELLPDNPPDRFAAYGWLNSVLASVVFSIGSPIPDEDKKMIDEVSKKVKHPKKMHGTGTYWQSITDLTNLVYYFKSVSALSCVYVYLSFFLTIVIIFFFNSINVNLTIF